jgi:acetoin utilization deacetylase AcuC-like enzyme
MGRRTGFVWHETFMWHMQGKYSGLLPAVFPMQPGEHVEGPEAKRRIKNLLDATGLIDRLVAILPRPAADAEILRAHGGAYVTQLQKDNERAEASAGFDAPFSRGSFDIARLAAGGAIEAVDAIFAGRVDNAYLLARPIGHHAERDQGKGFCLLNNGAIAAAHALDKGLAGRVAFVDVDVHHGNGAENIFWRDPRALTISLHQERWFPPDSGDRDAIGEGPGEGFNINIPLPAGCGSSAYRAAFERIVLPALEAFRPELIVAPFGFDAGAQDPLGRMILSSNNFRDMAEQVVGAAERLCGGRLLVTHEGGYNESSTPFMALAVIEAISGIPSGIEDPYAFIMDHMFGHELLDHQHAAVEAAHTALDRLSVALAREGFA